MKDLEEIALGVFTNMLEEIRKHDLTWEESCLVETWVLKMILESRWIEQKTKVLAEQFKESAG